MVETKKETLKHLITFVAITTILSTGIFIWMFNGAGNSMGAVFIMMWVPGISAILTSFIHKDNIRAYGWKVRNARILAYSYLLPLVAALIAYGLVWLSGYAEFYTDEVINYRWAKMLGFTLPVPFVIGLLSKLCLASLIGIVFVLGEEIGWSGFFTPKLSKISSVPVTSILVGGYWALWHYPAIIGGLYGSGTPLWVALPGFTLVLVGASFFRTVLVLKSKSFWPGVVLHVSHNIIVMGIFYEMTVKKGYAAYLVSETGAFLGLIYILIAVIFWRIQAKSIVR